MPAKLLLFATRTDIFKDKLIAFSAAEMNSKEDSNESGCQNMDSSAAEAKPDESLQSSNVGKVRKLKQFKINLYTKSMHGILTVE